MAVPSGVASREERNNPLGSLTSRMPFAVCSKQPTSSVAPKRFFKPRSMRSEECLSPSKCKTTSTRCSRTRGPATFPSLVTCPTRITETPVVLARVVNAAVTARDWATPPGTPSTPGACIVCTESTTISVGFSLSTWWKMVSKLDSATSSKFSSKAPVRSARKRTWPVDSSAVAYSTLFCPLFARAACAATSRSSVDLPTPGSPDSRTTEPGTKPLPRTRSSSAMPVVVAVVASTGIDVIG